MTCKRYKISLSSSIDRELSFRQEADMREHLAGCDRCRAELASLRVLKDLCGQIEISEPSWDRERFRERLRSLPPRSPSSQGKSIWKRSPGLARRFAAAMLLAAAALCAFAFSQRSPESHRAFRLIEPAEAQRNWKFKGVEHEPIDVTPNVPSYDSNRTIRGAKEAGLSGSETDFLHRYGFVVTSREFPSFMALYRENEEKRMPSFVTMDSVISGFAHIMARLRVDLEREVFCRKLREFTTSLAQELIELHGEVPESCKEASLRTLAFIRVADHLVGRHDVAWPPELEERIRPLVEEELRLISDSRENQTVAIQKSPIFGSEIDYSRFKSRWNETKDDNLKRYYQTLEWYNRCVFRPTEASETRSALLMLMAIIGDSAEGMYAWQDLNRLLTMMYGEADDPNFLDYLAVAREVYGESITPQALADEEALGIFCRKAARVRLPKIRSELQLRTGLRVFGERYYERDLYLQQLVYPYVGTRADVRAIPSVLDLAVIMGSPKARKIAEERYFEYARYAEKITQYQGQVEKSLRSGSPWEKGGFIAQAWLYESLMNAEGLGYPEFARSEPWSSRKLTSILCGVLNLAEINTRPVFTGGLVPIAEPAESFIDPYPEFFNRMATLIGDLEERIDAIGYPEDRQPAQEILAYRQCLKKLTQTAGAALAGERITPEMHNWLREFTMGWDGEYEEASLNELSTLFHRNFQEFDIYFYAGIEPVREIWVACPGKNGLYLARGGVYVLYEFPTTRKILPRQWREERMWQMLESKMLPWIQDYLY